MVEILTRPKVKYIGRDLRGEKIYILKSDLIITFNDFPIVVEKGFKTDFASVPYPLSKWIKCKNRNYFYAPIVHDFLYSENEYDFTRRQADYVFLETMKAEQTPFRYKIPFFLAVRFGGSKYYQNY